MLELCFDRSTQGGLRVAQHCGESVIGGAVSVVVSGKGRFSQLAHRRAVGKARQEIEERRREAVSLGGDPADVLALSLGLDMGDIRRPLAEECSRRDLLRRWYDGNEEDLERDWHENLTTLARLRTLQAGETIRLWADQNPNSTCGLLFAAELLENTEAEVRVMLLPQWQHRSNNTVVRYQGWGEVHPEEFGHFLHLEQPLPPMVLKMMASRWRELKEENAPLRAVVNGEVRSVEETFYDGLIRKHLPEGEKKIGVLLGDILGRERPGIGDAWLADRVRAMLASGEYEMVREDRKRFYGSVIRRAGSK